MTDVVDAGFEKRRTRHDRRVLQAGPGQSPTDVFGPGGQRLVVDQVTLGEGDDGSVHPEDVDDLQVFFGLRPPSLVRGDDEEDQPDRSHAGQHVADESFMPRHVDEADLAP